jgi:transposase-like protein
MHPAEVKRAALDLIAAGHNDCEVARRLGIPRRTIMDWRRPTYVPKRTIPLESCPRCWASARPIRFTPEDYAELLAVYLGDGSISTYPRTQRLRVALDRKYPGIIRDVESLLGRCFPENGVDVVSAIGCVHVSVYSSHLVCLLPQHAPGRKHERPIVLEPWQQKLIDVAPWPFIRGCIRTDGCAFINRTGPYAYLSYDFCNMSRDIVTLFTDSCAAVGVEFRVTQSRRQGIWRVRINRRESVRLMEQHVGLKA